MRAAAAMMLWRSFFLLAVGLVNVAMFYRMVWGPTGLREYRDLKRQYSELQERIADLDAGNLALSREIRLLQSNGQYVEKIIRQRLHYVRDNEVLYLFGDAAQQGRGSHDGKN